MFQKNNTLIVSCKDGHVLEIQAPRPGCYDTSHTYQVSGLEIRTHIFKSVKSQLRVRKEILSITKFSVRLSGGKNIEGKVVEEIFFLEI